EAALDLSEAVGGQRHVVVRAADDADIVAVMADGRGDGAGVEAEAVHEAGCDVAASAVPLDHRDLDDIVGEVDLDAVLADWQVELEVAGDDLARNDADGADAAAVGAGPEIRGGDAPRFDAVAADRRDRPAGCKQVVADDAPRRQHQFGAAVFQ